MVSLVMALIDNPDKWDAVQLVGRCQQQVWDEILAVVCPEVNPLKQPVPREHVITVMNSPAYSLLRRIEVRIMRAA